MSKFVAATSYRPTPELIYQLFIKFYKTLISRFWLILFLYPAVKRPLLLLKALIIFLQTSLFLVSPYAVDNCMCLSSKSSLTLSIHLFVCLPLLLSTLICPCSAACGSLFPFHKGFLVFLPGGDQSSPGRVRRPVGLKSRAVKSCQKTHPCNRSRQHRLTVYT